MLIIHCFHIKSPITEYFPQILDLHYTPCVNCFTVLVSLLLLLVQCCRRLFECLFISVFTGKIHLSHYLVGLFYYVLDAIALASPLLGEKIMDKGKFVQLYFYEIFVRELAWMNQILRHFLQSEHLKAFKISQMNCNLFKALANLITKQVILPIRNLTISVTFAVIFNALSSLCADILSFFFQICSQVRKDIWYNHLCQKMRINSNCLSPNSCLNFMFSQAKNGNSFKYALRRMLSDSV